MLTLIPGAATLGFLSVFFSALIRQIIVQPFKKNAPSVMLSQPQIQLTLVNFYSINSVNDLTHRRFMSAVLKYISRCATHDSSLYWQYNATTSTTVDLMHSRHYERIWSVFFQQI